MPAVSLLVVGVLLAVGAPTAWALTHRDPALTPIGQGIAVALAESGTGGVTTGADAAAAAGSAGATGTGAASAATDPPTSPPSATLSTVPTATTSTPTAVAPPGTTRAAAITTPASPSRAGRPTPSKAATPTSSTGRPKAAATSTAAAAAGPTSTATPAPVPAPTRLRIPAIGVDAPVGPVGLNDQGQMAIPQQVQDIGWYEYGPAPGATQGSAVLSGHVDSAEQGLGAFSRLGELTAGDVITVTDAAGRQLPYRVVGKEAFDKKTVPLADLFSRSGAARLTLITCGGAFDSAAKHYLDNIVVTAVPA